MRDARLALSLRSDCGQVTARDPGRGVHRRKGVPHMTVYHLPTKYVKVIRTRSSHQVGLVCSAAIHSAPYSWVWHARYTSLLSCPSSCPSPRSNIGSISCPRLSRVCNISSTYCRHHCHLHRHGHNCLRIRQRCFRDHFLHRRHHCRQHHCPLCRHRHRLHRLHCRCLHCRHHLHRRCRHLLRHLHRYLRRLLPIRLRLHRFPWTRGL